jgi:hypothetical protein
MDSLVDGCGAFEIKYCLHNQDIIKVEWNKVQSCRKSLGKEQGERCNHLSSGTRREEIRSPSSPSNVIMYRSIFSPLLPADISNGLVIR